MKRFLPNSFFKFVLGFVLIIAVSLGVTVAADVFAGGQVAGAGEIESQ